LDPAKLEHVTRSYISYHQTQQGTAGQDALGQLLLAARLRAITGGQSGSAWDTLAQLQKIVSVDVNLQRVTGWDHQPPATTTETHAPPVATWQKLARYNLPAELYKLLDLFSGGEGFVKPILGSGEILSGRGMSLGRLYHEITITLEHEQYLYQSRLDGDPPTLTVGIKDTTFDNPKAIAIGKLFGTALLNHPDVKALSEAQKDLRATWGLSASTKGGRYGLTTGLALTAFPGQKDRLYTRFIDGIGTSDHNWQFASGSVADFAEVLYSLSTRHDQDELTEAFQRVRNYHRLNPLVSLDTFTSALVETHRNLPDFQAGLTLRQAIGSGGYTFLKTSLKVKST
ncbi:hypothetical protein, partial [Endozoicomonas sp. SESOKO3]|uniref:hypothetical protein n=1 Tax=Endozoicomonas sp. SESOKO3 TaxID=2828744 RepID=UPI00214855D8